MARRRGRWLALLALAIVAGVVVFRLLPHGHKTGHHAQPIPVKVASAATRNVPVYLDALGTVAPYRTVTVQPMITGPLRKVLFHEGERVKQGQLLAEIDPAPYQASLAQAQAKLAQDKASLANAELQAKQYEQLVRRNYTSKQQAATARATAEEDRALVQQDQANIKTDRINLGYTRITAPIAGRTGILQINAGNIVNPSLSGGIVTINTLQPISVRFSLPQQDLQRISAAMRRGSVPLVATQEGDPATAPVLDHGTLTVLDNTVNAATGTLTLKGKFPNPKLDLWPGAYVNVRMQVRTLDHAVTVPPVALQQGPEGSFVYLIEPPAKGAKTPTVAVRNVTIAYDSETVAVISKGLDAGDRVVTEGGSRLKDGAAVDIVSGKPAAGAKTAQTTQQTTAQASGTKGTTKASTN